MGYRPPILLAALVAAGAPCVARAEGPPSVEASAGVEVIEPTAPDDSSEGPVALDPLETPPVIVDGEARRPVRDPLSVGDVLDAEGTGGFSVGDLLRGLPGGQLRSAGGAGQRTTLSLRGADGQQVLVLLDDVPLGTPMGGGVDLSLLPLAGLGSVEIYRGGSAVLGGDAIGGAVRLVPGALPDVPVTQLRTGGGSFGTGLITAAHAGTYGGLGISLAAGYQHSEGAFEFIDGNGALRTRANNHTDVAGGTLRLVYAPTQDVELTLADTAQGAERGVPGVDQFPTPEAHGMDATNVARLGLRVRDAGADGLDLTAAAWHRFATMRLEDPAPWLPPPLDNRHVVHGAGGHLELQWYWGDHQIVTGRVEGRGDWATVERTEAPDQTPSRGGLGVVLSDEVTLADDVVRFAPAIRLDVAEGFAPVVVPKLGVEVRPLAQLAFRANVGRAYRLPTFEELYYDAGQVRGNPDLSPEDALTMDAGVELDLGWFRASTTWFRLQITNLIVFLPKTAFLIEADDGKAALSQGVEAALHVRPVEGLELGASYTFTDARFEDTGARLPGRSAHQVGARVAGRVWRVGAWVSGAWQSEMPLDRFGSLLEEGRVTLSAGIDGAVTDWLTLELEGTNLLDVRGAVDALQQPLPGLAVLGSARVEL